MHKHCIVKITKRKPIEGYATSACLHIGCPPNAPFSSLVLEPIRNVMREYHDKQYNINTAYTLLVYFRNTLVYYFIILMAKLPKETRKD
jgi:hypothetical protein